MNYKYNILYLCCQRVVCHRRYLDMFVCMPSAVAVVSVCSEKNPCKNGGHCVDVASEEELKNVGVRNGGKSRQTVVRKYTVSRCVCRPGFSGQRCQHGKLLPVSFSVVDLLICLSAESV